MSYEIAGYDGITIKSSSLFPRSCAWMRWIIYFNTFHGLPWPFGFVQHQVVLTTLIDRTSTYKLTKVMAHGTSWRLHKIMRSIVKIVTRSQRLVTWTNCLSASEFSSHPIRHLLRSSGDPATSIAIVPKALPMSHPFDQSLCAWPAEQFSPDKRKSESSNPGRCRGKLTFKKAQSMSKASNRIPTLNNTWLMIEWGYDCSLFVCPFYEAIDSRHL